MPVANHEELLKAQQDLWEEMLTRQGLSMEAGANPAVMSYGWNKDWKNKEGFDYTLNHKPADPRGGARQGTGRKAQCVKHLSARCQCPACVNPTPLSIPTTIEGRLGRKRAGSRSNAKTNRFCTDGKCEATRQTYYFVPPPKKVDIARQIYTAESMERRRLEIEAELAKYGRLDLHQWQKEALSCD